MEYDFFSKIIGAGFISKGLVALGLLLVALGLASNFLRRYPWLYSWFGNLPGDFRYESEGTFIFAPLGSMLVLSAVVSLIVFLVRKMMGA